LGVFDRLLTVLRMLERRRFIYSRARGKTTCICDSETRHSAPQSCHSTGDISDYAKAPSNDVRMKSCVKIDIGGRSYQFQPVSFERFDGCIKLYPALPTNLPIVKAFTAQIQTIPPVRGQNAPRASVRETFHPEPSTFNAETPVNPRFAIPPILRPCYKSSTGDCDRNHVTILASIESNEQREMKRTRTARHAEPESHDRDDTAM
jgi:hypothetical protein